MAPGLRRVLLALAVAPWWAPAQAAEPRTPLPVIERARAGTQCIADPATMRRGHPAMLEHQRDLTVRAGIRGAKASLKACIACHVSPTTGSVAQSGSNFCISCHSYTAVRIDCFGCHATRPPSSGSQAAALSGAQGEAAAQPGALPGAGIGSVTLSRLP